MKAAILGAGFIAEFHALGYEAIEDVELCAVCDTDTQKAQALAERVGFEPTCRFRQTDFESSHV